MKKVTFLKNGSFGLKYPVDGYMIIPGIWGAVQDRTDKKAPWSVLHVPSGQCGGPFARLIDCREFIAKVQENAVKLYLNFNVPRFMPEHLRCLREVFRTKPAADEQIGVIKDAMEGRR